MYLLLNHKLKFVTADSKEVFLEKVLKHAVYSKSKNFFTATADDYVINCRLENNTIIMKNRFGKGGGKLVVTITSEHPTEICVRPVHGILSKISSLLMVSFLLIMPFPTYFKIFLIGVLYILALIRYGLELWWVSNLFNYKLLTKP
jgi:hypothetical protein